MLEYGATDFKMYHVNVDVALCLSFKSQTFFARMVSLLLGSFLKDVLWL